MAWANLFARVFSKIATGNLPLAHATRRCPQGLEISVRPAAFLKRSVVFHWRSHLTVALGVVVATATLTGALLVGDSMRGGLLDHAVHRLGRID